MHYFPRRLCFFSTKVLFETGRINGYSQYCKLVPQHSQLLYHRVHLGLKVIKKSLLKTRSVKGISFLLTETQKERIIKIH